jgi:hypothetical protein
MCDGIGKAIACMFLCIFVLGAVIGIGGYFVVSWLLSHISFAFV